MIPMSYLVISTAVVAYAMAIAVWFGHIPRRTALFSVLMMAIQNAVVTALSYV